MTHEKQLERLSDLGWTCRRSRMKHPYYYECWEWYGPNSKKITVDGRWSEPAPIPDELLALIEPLEMKAYKCADCDIEIQWPGGSIPHRAGRFCLECWDRLRPGVPDEQPKQAHMTKLETRIKLLAQSKNAIQDTVSEQLQRIAELDAKIEELEKLLIGKDIRLDLQDAKIERLEALLIRAADWMTGNPIDHEADSDIIKAIDELFSDNAKK